MGSFTRLARCQDRVRTGVDGAVKPIVALQRCKSVTSRWDRDYVNSLFRFAVLRQSFFGMPLAGKTALMPSGCIAYAPIESRTP
jgi:hypothetical protein